MFTNANIPPYSLEKKGKNHPCPQCNERRFTRYVDTVSGEYLADHVGRCSRSDSCGYHYPPREYFRDNATGHKPDFPPPPPLPKPKEMPVFIPNEILDASLDQYEQNSFVTYLNELFGEDITRGLITRYRIGTSNHWGGSTVFWFVDNQNRVRAGQVKQFDETGHTIKDVTNQGKQSRTTWVHSILQKSTVQSWPQWLQDYTKQENKAACLFGEHLLKTEPTKPVALFEAPKTAIIATPFLSDFLCLAVGALDWLSESRLQALKGRNVLLYPDLSKEGKAFTKWANKAKELAHLAHFRVSEFLEENATDEERAQGLDVADYLVRFVKSAKSAKCEAPQNISFSVQNGLRVWNITNQADLDQFAQTLPNRSE